jgi:hypothetical protein
MTGDGRPLVELLPLLEHPFDESDLDPASAVRLVHYALRGSDYWAGKALDWVDEGVLSGDIGRALLRLSQDRRYAQQTRHRAWAHVKDS